SRAHFSDCGGFSNDLTGHVLRSACAARRSEHCLASHRQPSPSHPSVSERGRRPTSATHRYGEGRWHGDIERGDFASTSDPQIWSQPIMSTTSWLERGATSSAAKLWPLPAAMRSRRLTSKN